MKHYYLYCCCFFMLLTASCEKLVEVDAPPYSIDKEDVYKNDVTATSAIGRLYTKLPTDGFFNIGHVATLSADEIMIEQQDPNDVLYQINQNNILSVNSKIESCWEYHFGLIYNTNSVIEGLRPSVTLTPSLKNQLLGEALFFRAFAHFYLVNLFGNIPYISTTDYRQNGVVTRMPVPDVYEKIIADLLEARELLSEDYVFAKSQRVRVNKWAAASFLARVYLFKGDWVHAEEQATTVLNKTDLYKLEPDLNKVFLKNSGETIWQVIPSTPTRYVYEGTYYNNGGYFVGVPMLTDGLYNAFEATDKRKSAWLGFTSAGSGHDWHFPLKYKEYSGNETGAEYSMVLRLAEQYLIRAEARVKQSKLTGANSAASDINAIRDRAGLPATTATTEPELLAAIEQERRVELFSEWGHRWFDLKRTGRATAVLSPVKPGWTATDMLYPIPYSELSLNANMTQNPGY
jgi:starch-binding outer membrane protein, SusD/RagB family